MRLFSIVTSFLVVMLALMFLVGCPCPKCGEVEGFDVTLSPNRLSPGEEVMVELSREVGDVRVTVAGDEVAAEQRSDTTFIFTLSEDIPAGPQEVVVAEAQGGSGSATLDVFGQDIVEGEAVIAFQTTPDVSDEQS